MKQQLLEALAAELNQRWPGLATVSIPDTIRLRLYGVNAWGEIVLSGSQLRFSWYCRPLDSWLEQFIQLEHPQAFPQLWELIENYFEG